MSLCAWGACWGEGQGRVNKKTDAEQTGCAPLQSDALHESVPTSVNVSSYESVCVGGVAAMGGGPGEGQPETNAEQTGCALLQSDALLESAPTSVDVSSYESVCVGSLLEGGSGGVNQRRTQNKLDAPLFNRMLF